MTLSRPAFVELLLQGKRDLAAIKAAGDADPGMKWYGLRGAMKYLLAIRRGDVASQEDSASRYEKCRACASATPLPSNPNVKAGYCGAPLRNRLRSTPPTCGCLLPGKVAVASEACPQGRWGAVEAKI